ncbi:MAG TPA: branched-chain amino acid aminotransferase [Gammaproteobacteria bacterium]|nr:branched-chain amino acid aminotransferase [Gammaproteobacteria bacterium]
MSIFPDLRIQTVEKSRLGEVDFDDLGFGDVFCDHMFSMVFEDGRWQRPEILPFGPLPLHPSALSLHYGQAVFEGLKAFCGGDGVVRVFRPDMNAKRLLESCRRLCIPPIESAAFHAAIEHLIRLDHAWIPRVRGQSLYIRPIVFGTESHLEVRPARTFRFVVMTAPVRKYFQDDVKAIELKAEEKYTRAAPGGMGYAKTAGNYAASLYPGELGRSEGYAQVLWLDGAEHRYVEEVGAMNIFFKFRDTVVTPELHGTILPGVTRDSVITLLKDQGMPVEERLVDIDEVIDGMRSGALEEIFGAGTAAVICPVGAIAYKGRRHEMRAVGAGPLTRKLYDTITGIQLGEVRDKFGWTRSVDLDAPASAAAAGE